MKKILALIISSVLIFTLSACSYNIATTNTEHKEIVTSAMANDFLTSFFSSYSRMSEYVTREDIALSSYTLLTADLPSLLKASYQAKSITYTFDIPEKTGDNTFTCNVTVEAPDVNLLYEAYLIDTLIDPEIDIVNSFYSNINSGATQSVKSESITLMLTYQNGEWNISSNNALVYAIFPNINSINA